MGGSWRPIGIDEEIILILCSLGSFPRRIVVSRGASKLYMKVGELGQHRHESLNRQYHRSLSSFSNQVVIIAGVTGSGHVQVRFRGQRCVVKTKEVFDVHIELDS